MPKSEENFKIYNALGAQKPTKETIGGTRIYINLTKADPPKRMSFPSPSVKAPPHLYPFPDRLSDHADSRMYQAEGWHSPQRYDRVSLNDLR